MKANELELYFLDLDNSGHWYVVPEVRRADWDKWTNLDEDDERSWDAPSFARRLPGSPSRVVFGLSAAQLRRACEGK